MELLLKTILKRFKKKKEVIDLQKVKALSCDYLSFEGLLEEHAKKILYTNLSKCL